MLINSGITLHSKVSWSNSIKKVKSKVITSIEVLFSNRKLTSYETFCLKKYLNHKLSLRLFIEHLCNIF